MTYYQYFSLVDVQARMALKADASKYFLGYIWWILEPLLFVAVFYLVFEVILGTNRADFLVFLMCGKLPFVWFSKSVSQAANSIVSSAGLIGRVDVPKSLFPMSIIHECMYKQLAVFVLLIAVVLINKFHAGLGWLWLAPVVLVNYLLIVGCSFLGSMLVCYMRDFTMLISLGMIFLMFTSGIFWDVRDLPEAYMTELILTYNPIAFILDAYRQVLMHNTPPDLVHLISLAGGSALLVCCMLLLLRRTSKRLALKALTA